MMKYFNILLLALTVFLGGNISLGQEYKYSAVYDFHVHNPEELTEGKVQIDIFKDGINSFFGKNLDYIEMAITDSITRVLVPIPEKINYLRLSAFFGRLEGSESLIDLHVGNNLFIVEAGDTVEIHLYPKRLGPIIFKGEAADKYTFQYQQGGKRKIKDDVYTLYRFLFEQNKYREAFAHLKDWADSLSSDLNNSLINSVMSEEIKNRLMYDNLGAIYNTKRRLMQSALENVERKSDEDLRRAVLMELSLAIKVKDYDQRYAVKSMLWGDMLLFREWVKFALERHPDQVGIVKDNDYGFANYLAERYTGVVRDKLFYLALVRQWDMYGLKLVALPILKNSVYGDAFKKLNSRMEGSVIYDVEMQDREGKIHRFSDYKGKVLVIDMWYTGCIPCRYLAKELKIIQDEMMDRDDVVFISLSFDRYKDLWGKSLKTGDYTHERGVNLWIGEQAMKHPIVEHYSIRGVPQLLIVDKNGVIVALNPPRPISTDPQTRIDFKKLVESYR